MILLVQRPTLLRSKYRIVRWAETNKLKIGAATPFLPPKQGLEMVKRKVLPKVNKGFQDSFLQPRMLYYSFTSPTSRLRPVPFQANIQATFVKDIYRQHVFPHFNRALPNGHY